jgi:hypothetical protein
MRVGLFRRIGSFLLDAIPIFFLLSLLFTLFIGQIIKPDGYDEMYAEYQEINEEYTQRIGVFEEQYEDGEITEEEFLAEYDNHMQYFALNTREHVQEIFRYFINTIFYYIISFNMIYYVYSGFTKGKTLGRRMAKIQLTGNVNWWTLFVREIVWKFGYWMILGIIGGIFLDVAMIGLGAKKQAPRDIITGIKLSYEGVQYPF